MKVTYSAISVDGCEVGRGFVFKDTSTRTFLCPTHGSKQEFAERLARLVCELTGERFLKLESILGTPN